MEGLGAVWGVVRPHSAVGSLPYAKFFEARRQEVGFIRYFSEVPERRTAKSGPLVDLHV